MDESVAAPAPKDEDAGLVTPWPDIDLTAGPRGGPEHAAVHLAQRRVQDLLAGATLPPDLSLVVAERLEAIAAVAAAHQGTESHRYDGFRSDLPGRGHPFLPPYTVTDERDGWLCGTVEFGRFHLGGNGAAHGGSIPALFDDVLGRVANHHQAGVARTAALTTNYRSVTPIGVELTFEATLDRIEGRKRYATARLFGPSGKLLADADSLFVALRPGQQ